MALICDAPLTSLITGFGNGQAIGTQVDLTGNNVATAIAGRIEISTAPDGAPAMMSRITPSDDVTFGGIRSEINQAAAANAERWYVWEIFIPAGFASADLISFMQIHDTPDGGESPVKFPNLEFQTQNGLVFCQVPRNCPSELTSTGRVPAGQLVSLSTGRWVKCGVHANWATDSTGFFEVFYDGNLLAREWFRASGYTDAVGPYLKLGLYDFAHAGISKEYSAWYRNCKVYSVGHLAFDVLGVQPVPTKLIQLGM